MAVPSIFIVAPSGSTKAVTSWSAPRSSQHFIFIGKVPIDDADEKANIIAEDIPLKNSTGLRPPKVFIVNEYTIKA